ncbi:hypothetical protein [Pelosinus sp. IPA-1]|uniref:hypothetical protein n=1 Tax=Pelosinus sp. IPA-1 TaxID=3029569 RepID=UPI002555D9E6|nr:hypothetical protein [Pelosinus sp. IPA-1]
MEICNSIQADGHEGTAGLVVHDDSTFLIKSCFTSDICVLLYSASYLFNYSSASPMSQDRGNWLLGFKLVLRVFVIAEMGYSACKTFKGIG